MFEKATVASGPGEAWRGFYQRGQLSWYRPDSATLDYVRRFARSDWITQIFRAANIRPGPELHVLEAGCGTGLFSVAMALLGCRVDAFDYGEEALEIARDLKGKIEAENGPLQLHFYQNDITNIRAPSGSYDLVYNQAVLEYFQDDRERAQAISEMIRVLKPGGHLSITVQHTGHPFGKLWRQMGWLGYTDQPPVTIYSPNRLRQDLVAQGLSNVRVDGIYPWKAFFFWPPWYRRWKSAEYVVYVLGILLHRYARIPRWARSHLALQIIGTGEKPPISSI